jgi:phospholipase/carboxylesterase
VLTASGAESPSSAHKRGVLRSRPDNGAGKIGPVGTGPIGIGQGRDGLRFVPGSVIGKGPRPLIIMLHGAGATASDVLPMVADRAEQEAVIVLAPDARGATWDVIGRGYGPDVAFVDEAVDYLFESYAIDPRRIAIAGFSDGASYALSLGLINGNFVSDVLAFSPGFMLPTETEDRPRIFVSHGRDDTVLPIDRCGRRIVATLEQAGYDVDYREFVGGHVVPSELVGVAFDRFLRPREPQP